MNRLLSLRQSVLRIFLFKVLPLPGSREIAPDDEYREHYKREHDTLPERLRAQQRKSEEDD